MTLQYPDLTAVEAETLRRALTVVAARIWHYKRHIKYMVPQGYVPDDEAIQAINRLYRLRDDLRALESP